MLDFWVFMGNAGSSDAIVGYGSGLAHVPEERYVVRSCCGVRIGLKSNTPALLPLLSSLVPGSNTNLPVHVAFSLHEKASTTGSRRYEIALNGRRAPVRFSLAEALHTIQCYMQECIAMLARDVVLVHAAVVGWKGRALLLPGMSGSGKSTLAMALVEHGATYYSDEFAVIDKDAYVHPYLRTPRLRGVTGCDTAIRTTKQISAGLIPPEPLPAGLVLLSRYSEGAKWSPGAVPCREILFGLLENTVAVRNRPELSLQVLKRVSVCATGLEGERGEANAVAGALLASI